MGYNTIGNYNIVQRYYKDKERYIFYFTKKDDINNEGVIKKDDKFSINHKIDDTIKTLLVCRENKEKIEKI